MDSHLPAERIFIVAGVAVAIVVTIFGVITVLQAPSENIGLAIGLALIWIVALVLVAAANVLKYDWTKPSTYGTTKAGAPPSWQLLTATVVLAAIVVLLTPVANIGLALGLGLLWVAGTVVFIVLTRAGHRDRGPR